MKLNHVKKNNLFNILRNLLYILYQNVVIPIKKTKINNNFIFEVSKISYNIKNLIE